MQFQVVTFLVFLVRISVLVVKAQFPLPLWYHLPTCMYVDVDHFVSILCNLPTDIIYCGSIISVPTSDVTSGVVVLLTWVFQ